MGPCSDAEVIAASIESPASFGELFDRHATTLFRYLVRRVGPDEADSLLGEVFRIAFERRSSYDLTRSAARPWLYGIASNLLARHHRSEARRLAATARLANSVTAADDALDAVDDRLDATERLMSVASAIATLPAPERDVLLLYAWEQLSYGEIAAGLDLPVGTVRSRLHRARARLREPGDADQERPVTPELRPDRVLPLDEADPELFARERKRLMADIDAPTEPPPAPDHTPAMYPRLTYSDEVAALDFLTRVFQFTERREARMESDDAEGMLAWLEFGDGVIMIGRATSAAREVHRLHSPAEVGHATVMINVAVNDIDAHYAHAVAAGATITMPIEDAFYGFRRYEADDLEGHRWHFQEPLDAIERRTRPDGARR